MSGWNVSGSYYEACNCEAICPCRRHGDRPAGRSTYGVCDFVLSWVIQSGQAEGVDLAARTVVMAGSYDDDEPGSPFRVVLYLDDRCTTEQHEKLSEIFLERAAFTRAIGEVKAVRSAVITLDHEAHSERVNVDPYITVRTRVPVDHTEPVSCGIPGHDRPGREIIAEVMRVEDDDLSWEVRGRCGFTTDFSYSG